MASEEAKFVARAERLAGPQNRYVVPEFEEKTPYGYILVKQIVPDEDEMPGFQG